MYEHSAQQTCLISGDRSGKIFLEQRDCSEKPDLALLKPKAIVVQKNLKEKSNTSLVSLSEDKVARVTLFKQNENKIEEDKVARATLLNERKTKLEKKEEEFAKVNQCVIDLLKLDSERTKQEKKDLGEVKDCANLLLTSRVEKIKCLGHYIDKWAEKEKLVEKIENKKQQLQQMECPTSELKKKRDFTFERCRDRLRHLRGNKYQFQNPVAFDDGRYKDEKRYVRFIAHVTIKRTQMNKHKEAYKFWDELPHHCFRECRFSHEVTSKSETSFVTIDPDDIYTATNAFVSVNNECVNAQAVSSSVQTFDFEHAPYVFPKRKDENQGILAGESKGIIRTKIDGQDFTFFDESWSQQSFPHGFSVKPLYKESSIIRIQSLKQLYNALQVDFLGKDVTFLLTNSEMPMEMINRKYSNFEFSDQAKIRMQCCESLDNVFDIEEFSKEVDEMLKDEKYIVKRVTDFIMKDQNHLEEKVEKLIEKMIMKEQQSEMIKKILTRIEEKLKGKDRVYMQSLFGGKEFLTMIEGHIAKFTETVEAFKETLNDSIVPSMVDQLRQFLVNVVLGIFMMYKSKETSVQVAAGLSIINSIPFNIIKKHAVTLFNQMMELAKYVKNKFVGRITMQAEGDENVVENVFVSFVKVLGGFFKVQDFKSVRVEDFRVKRLINISKVINGSKNIYEFITKFVERFSSGFQLWLYGVEDLDEAYYKIDKAIPEWLDRTKLFEISVTDDGEVQHTCEKLKDYESKLELVRLYNEGLDHAKLIGACSATAGTRAIAYFNSRLKRLEKILDASGASLVGLQGKHEPFSIYIHGKPGTGKSLMVDHLVKGMYECQRKTYDFKRDKFSKSPTTQYWDGYCQQKVFMIDDFFQTKDSEMRTKDLSDMIMICSRTAMPLDMAHIEGKGTSFFNSELVVLTAQEKFSSNVVEKCIESYDAFERRVDVFVKAIPKEEFMKGPKIDRKKLNESSTFKTDVCNYEIETGEFKRIVSFDELVMTLAFMQEKKNLRELQMDADMRETRNWWDKYLKFKNDNIQQQGVISSVAEWIWKKKELNGTMTQERREWELTLEEKHRLIHDDTIHYNAITNIAGEDYLIEAANTTEFEKELEREEITRIQAWIHNGTDKPEVTTKRGMNCMETIMFYVRKDALKMETLKSFKHFEVKRLDAKIKRNVRIFCAVLMTITSMLSIWAFYSERKRQLKMEKEGKWEEYQKSFINQGNVKKEDESKLFEAYIPEEKITKIKNEYIASGDETTQKFRIGKKFRENSEESKRDLPYSICKSESDRNAKFLIQLINADTHEHTCISCGRQFVHTHISEGEHQHEDFVCPNRKCKKFIENDPDFNAEEYNRCNPTVDIMGKSKDEIIDILLGRTPKSEAARDPNLMNILEAVRNNIVNVKCVENGFKLNGAFLKGNLLMVPSHLFCGIDEISEVEIVINGSKISNSIVRMSDCKIEEDAENDMCLIQINNSMLYKDITKLFVKNDEIVSYYGSGYVVKLSPSSIPIYQQVTDINAGQKLKYYPPDDDENKTKELVRHLKYTSDTQPGDCGSLLFANNVAIPRKILGMHVAGTSGNGYSSIITQEILEKLAAKFITLQAELSIPINELIDTNEMYLEEDVVEVIGELPADISVYQPTKTKIVPSFFENSIKAPTTRPACLKRANGLDPMRMGISKTFVKDISFPEWAVELAKNDVSNQINNMKSSYKANKVWDEPIVVNGIPGDPYIEPMNMKTSAGYPWILKSKKGKYDWVDGEVGNFFLKSEVREHVEKVERSLLTDKPIVPLYIDALKDERRPNEKVDAMKTRIFSCCPMEFTYLYRKYFGQFLAHIMDNHVYGEVSVGINPHSDEWGMMFNDCKNSGDNWIAGDYGAYDKRLPHQVILTLIDIVNEFYGGNHVDSKIRENLIHLMANSYHIANGTIYKVSHGMPSGVPLTAVANSILNGVLFRINFLLNAEKEFGKRAAIKLFFKFNELVKMKFYGDDHIVRVSNQIPWFNMNNIAETYKEFGIEYTTATKGVVDQDYEFESDLSYLKRKFRCDRGIIYAPLEINSIYEMTNWIRGCEDNYTASILNVQVALLEMTHHGKTEWASFYKKIRDHAKLKAIRMPFYTYELCLEIQKSGDINIKKIEEVAKSESIHEMREIKRKVEHYMTKQPKMQAGVEGGGQVDDVYENDSQILTGITTFSEQANTVSSEITTMPLMSELNTYKLQTIKQFVERPFLVNQFEWRDTSEGLITEIILPDYLFRIRSIWSKLKNFRFFRSNVKLSVRMNGTKFHYGKLMFCWFPAFNNGAMQSEKEYYHLNAISMTSFPNVIVSPTSNEVHEIKIPFVAPRFFVDLEELTLSNIESKNELVRTGMGRLFVIVLNPLQANVTPVPSVSVSIFAQFEDIQLEAYSNNVDDYIEPIYPFNPSAKYRKDKISGYLNLGKGRFQDTLNFEKPRMQANKEAEEKSRSRIVSTALSVGSTVAGALSFVPAVGIVGKVASGLLGAGSMVAKYFGYTKPNSLETKSNVVLSYPDITHSRGLESARSLGISSENAVGTVSHWLGSSKEEMLLTNIISRFGLLWQGQITVNQAVGTRLFILPVDPMCIAYTAAPGGKSINAYHTPLSYITSLFKFWRGTIKYKLQFVASSFHACRVRVCWHPALPDDSREPAIWNEANVISHVVDISTDTEFEFDIPYLQAKPFASVVKDAHTFNGYITITILNPLTHPSLIIPPIYVNLWVAGGADFQFGKLSSTFTSNKPFVSTTEEEDEKIYMQVESAQHIDREHTQSLIPANHVKVENMCFGEDIVNVKDIIMRSVYVKGLHPGINYKYLYYDTTVVNKGASAIDMMSKIFRFRRGSLNYKVLRVEPGTVEFYSIVNFEGETVTIDEMDTLEGYSFFPRDTTIMPEAQLPYYCSSVGLPTEIVAQFYPTHDGIPVVVVVTEKVAKLFESAADDYEFCYQIGAPCLNYTNETFHYTPLHGG